MTLPTAVTSLVRCVAAAGVLLVAATPAHAAWSPPRAIPGAGAATLPSDVAVGADGTVAVVFLDGTRVHVVVRRGGRWRGPAVVSRPGGHGASSPRVAVDASGRVLAAWVRTTSRGRGPTRGPYRVEARSRTRDGRWGAVRELGISGHFRETGLDVAMNARGDAVIAWRGIHKLRRHNVDATAVAVRRGHGRFSSARVLHGGLSAAQQAAAIDARGTAHVVWTAGALQSRPQVRYARRGSSRWTQPRRVGSPPASEPAIAVDERGTPAIFWRAAPVDSEGAGVQSGGVFTRTIGASGAWGSAVTVAREPAHEVVATAVPSTGEVAALWRSEPGEDGLSVATSADGFAARARLDAGRPVAPVPPGLAATAAGDVLAAWSPPFGAAAPSGVRAAVRPARASFGPVETVSPTGLYPRLAAAGDQAVAVWLQSGRGATGLSWSAWRRRWGGR